MTQTTKTVRSESSHEPFRDRVLTPRFAGREAFRLRVVVIALTPLTAGSILVDGIPHTSSLSTVTFATVVSFLAAVVFFLAGGHIINRWCPHEGLLRTSSTVIVFGATEAIRTTVFSQSMVFGGAPVEILLPHRLLGGSMTGMLVIAIVSLLSVDRDRYYADYGRLIDRQQQLTRELEALNYTISQFVDELTTNVREAVDTALRPLAAGQRATSTADVVDHIVSVSENVVRPLSREVSAALPRVDVQGGGQPRVSPRRVFELMTIVAPFQPVGMPLIIFLLFFSASVFLLPPLTGILLITISVVGVWLSHMLGALFLQPRMPSWPVHWRIVVATMMYSLGFVVSLAVIIVQRGSGTTLDRLGTIVYVLLIVALVSWGVALIPAIREGQKEIIADHACSNRQFDAGEGTKRSSSPSRQATACINHSWRHSSHPDGHRPKTSERLLFRRRTARSGRTGKGSYRVEFPPRDGARCRKKTAGHSTHPFRVLAGLSRCDVGYRPRGSCCR